jgi:hypothetical protein
MFISFFVCRLVDSFCNLVIESLCRESPVEPGPDRLRSMLLSADKTEVGAERAPESAAINSIWQPVCEWSRQPLPPNCILGRILAVQMLEVPRSRVDPKVNGAFPFLDADEYLTPVQRYLLAATAKDCSVLLSFQQLSNERWFFYSMSNLVHVKIKKI